MSLATTCPRCGTSFKVVADQLKLRGGLVRCGVCRKVFSGVEALRPIDEAAAAPADTASMRVGAAGDAQARGTADETPPEADLPDQDTPGVETGASPAGVDDAPPVPDRVAAPPTVESSVAIEPTIESTPEPTIESTPEPTTEPTPEPTIEVALAPPATEFVTDHVLPGAEAGLTAAQDARRPDDRREAQDEADAVDFFGGRETARGFSSRGVAFAWFGSVVLAALLVLQVVIGARDWIAAWLPAARPLLAVAVAPLGLQVMPPRAIDALTIESFELQESGASGIYRISALLRNGAPHAVRWPSLELTLVDDSGTVIARRVLSAADYLGADSPSLPAGVGPKSELPIRGAIETRELAPTGYSVKVFYP